MKHFFKLLFCLLPAFTFGQTIEKLVDLYSGDAGVDFNEKIVPFDGAYYFTGISNLSGIEEQVLVKTDGTPSGTQIIHASTDDADAVELIGDLNNKLLAVNKIDEQLYLYESGVGFVKIKDDVAVQYASKGVFHNGTYYFAANVGSSVSQLWKTDGTSQGTVLVHDACVGCAPHPFGASYFRDMVVLDNKLVYLINESLWITNGIIGGEVLLKVFDSPFRPYILNPCGDYVYFMAASNNQIYEPYRTDGTVAGTIKLYTSVIAPPQFPSFVYLNGKTYFHYNDHFARTDGTVAGTELFSPYDVFGSSTFESDPNMWVWKDFIIFTRTVGQTVYYYITDENATEFVQIAHVDGDSPNKHFGAITEMNNRLFFNSVADAFIIGTGNDREFSFPYISSSLTSTIVSSPVVLARGIQSSFIGTENGILFVPYKVPFPTDDDREVHVYKPLFVDRTTDASFATWQPKVYPTITATFLQIEIPNQDTSEDYDWQISTNTGQVVLEGQGLRHQASVDVSSLATGMYYVQLWNKETRKTIVTKAVPFVKR